MKQIFVIAAVLILLMPGSIFAEMGPEGDTLTIPPGRWWRLPTISESHKITEQEQIELDQLYIHTRRNMIDLKGDLEKEFFELELLLDSSEIDDTACMNQFRKVQKARSEIVLERFKFVVEVRKLLGMTRFQELKEGFRTMRHAMPGNMPPPPFGN
ncbi:MAG: hypothetical protein K9L30_01330 [Desulfobacterales bacterium]|nr:hypothetical protein [Desulfobacterales bacterium]